MDVTSDEYRNVYLQSGHWKSVRERFAGCLCVCCGAKSGIELHHVTYCRLYEELDSDLRPLCGTCHEWVHEQIGYGGKLSLTDRFLAERRRSLNLPGDMKRGADNYERPAKPFKGKRKRVGQSRWDRNPLWFMKVPSPGERMDPPPPPQSRSRKKKGRRCAVPKKMSAADLELEAYRAARRADPVASIVSQAMRPRR